MVIDFNSMDFFKVGILILQIFILIKQKKTLKILNRTHFYQNINSDPYPPQNEKEWQKALQIYIEKENKKLEEKRKNLDNKGRTD